MATLTDGGYPNLLNVVKRLRPDGSVEQDVAELLAQKLDWLMDIPWVEANSTFGHQITGQLALPSPAWRRFNEGVTVGKGVTNQYFETCGMLQVDARVDKDLAESSGNVPAYRMTEDKMFLEGISQTLGTAVFYQSAATAPESIHGLSPRYGGTSGYTASSYVTVGTNSGTDAQSVWLINWEPEKVFGIYPKGSTAGLSVTDLGLQQTLDASSNPYWSYVNHYSWKCGIAVKDYRYATRHQWDPGDTTPYADSAKGLYLQMQAMTSTVYDVGPNAAFYMNRTSFRKLTAQLVSNTANFLEWVTVAGQRPFAKFMGIPVRITDSLVAETAIT